jgi:hypothetical protein
VRNSRDASLFATADLLVEALKRSDDVLELPYNQLSLTKDDITDIIDLICSD